MSLLWRQQLAAQVLWHAGRLVKARVNASTYLQVPSNTRKLCYTTMAALLLQAGQACLGALLCAAAACGAPNGSVNPCLLVLCPHRCSYAASQPMLPKESSTCCPAATHWQFHLGPTDCCCASALQPMLCPLQADMLDPCNKSLTCVPRSLKRTTEPLDRPYSLSLALSFSTSPDFWPSLAGSVMR